MAAHAKISPHLTIPRYVIAFAGDVTDDPFETDITHIITESLATEGEDDDMTIADTQSAINANPLAKVVTSLWIWACTEAGSPVSEEPYCLT